MCVYIYKSNKHNTIQNIRIHKDILENIPFQHIPHPDRQDNPIFDTWHRTKDQYDGDVLHYYPWRPLATTTHMTFSVDMHKYIVIRIWYFSVNRKTILTKVMASITTSRSHPMETIRITKRAIKRSSKSIARLSKPISIMSRFLRHGVNYNRRCIIPYLSNQLSGT